MDNPDEKEKEKNEKGPKLTRGERIAKRIDQVNISLYVATFGCRMRFLFLCCVLAAIILIGSKEERQQNLEIACSNRMWQRALSKV